MPSGSYKIIFSSLFLASVSLLMLSCSNEPEAAVVDFTNRMTVEQPGDPGTDTPYLRVAVAAMISAKKTAVHYHQLLNYIGGKLGRETQLIQRKTYGEINELFERGEIDLAFICTGPYVNGKKRYGFDALAIPEVRGNPFYQGYLIVNSQKSFFSLEDLRGRVFAFTDPESNTGKILPTYWLKQQGEIPENFFGKTIYTYSHDNSIMAVARALADAATVHGQIWEYYNKRDPIFTSKTRIIKKSEPFGNPPVVAASYLSDQTKEHIHKLLIEMHHDPEGKKILDELMIDRFIEPKEEWYEPILAMNSHM